MSGRKRLIRFKINKEKLRINYEYFRVILAEFLRIASRRSDLCNPYKKNGVIQLSTRLSTILYIFLAAENNIRVKNKYSYHVCFEFHKHTFFLKKHLKHNSVLSIIF